MKKLFMFTFTFWVLTACQAQDQGKVGGPCEGCEAIYEWGDKKLLATDTLPGFDKAENRLKVTGTIFQKDGKTPAGDVILYIYHTNEQGVYPRRGDEEGWGKRHGYLRGWIKTRTDGRYTFYTQKPGTYPDRGEPAHIHATVKEPGINEYYLADYHFSDDPLLKKKHPATAPRGGSGIVTLESGNGIEVAKRDIVLGLNIPGYE